jgi:3-hydroxyacyl-CoA dehydrogenase
MLGRSRLTAPSFLCVALASAILPVPLSTSQAQSHPPAQSGPSPNIPDQKLDKAAAALRQVSSIKQSYQQQLTEATTPAAKANLAQKADDEIMKAITKEGLSRQEYDAIIEIAQKDPDVRQKLLRRIDPSFN